MAGPAIPAARQDAPGKIQAGPAQAVQVVNDAYIAAHGLQAGKSIPVYRVTTGKVEAGPAVPVYFTEGGVPVADFSASVVLGDYPLSVTFTDLSTNTPTSWDWDFGDLSAHSTAQNPAHTYTAAGLYTVTLTATNASGSDSETKVGYVHVREYYEKVINVFGASLIAYWPLWEAAGAVADNVEGTAARDGAYSNVTLGQTGIGDGRTASGFNGTTSYTNVYSASLNGVFNGVAGTISAWFKVANVGVWTDGAQRTILNLTTNSNSQILMYKSTTNNRISCLYKAGGTDKFATLNGANSTDWLHLALTWDKNAGASGEVKGYIDGAQFGVTQTSLGVWAGALVSTACVIGSTSTTPASVFSGSLGHLAIGNTALTPAQIAQLAAV